MNDNDTKRLLTATTLAIGNFVKFEYDPQNLYFIKYVLIVSIDFEKLKNVLELIK
jgi:hypothetical protein